MILRQTAMALAIVGILSLMSLPITSSYAQTSEKYTDLRGRAYTSEEINCALFPEDCPQGQAAPSESPTFRGLPRRPSSERPPVTVTSVEPSPVVLNINFATNSDKVPAKHYADLNKLGEVLSRHPQARIEIAGYTDSVGSPAYNQALSERRAESVKRYLVQNFSVAPRHVSTKGHGPGSPIAPNETPEGREKNRRVQAARVE